MYQLKVYVFIAIVDRLIARYINGLGILKYFFIDDKGQISANMEYFVVCLV